jgi:hypothetical protein
MGEKGSVSLGSGLTGTSGGNPGHVQHAYSFSELRSQFQTGNGLSCKGSYLSGVSGFWEE